MKTIGAAILLFISSIFGFGQKSAETKPVVLTTSSAQETVVQKQIATTSVKSKTLVATTKAKTATVQKVANAVPKISTSVQTNKIAEGSSQNKDNIGSRTIDLVALNTAARSALVNILCQTQAGGPLSPISGSGVLISSDGVILTVAHVAQFFLLKDFNDQKNSVQCVIRIGSPAYSTYNAELVYISPTWVEQNKSVLLESAPQGTGEYDYAFLRITGKIDGTPLPVSFPFLSINISEIKNTGDFALLAAYPAGFLGGQSILQNLFQSSAETTVQEIYTFASTTVDVISLPGTVISQAGSSGGAVVDGDGQLIGLISTDTSADQTSGRDLRAITISYINRDLQAESGSTIADLLASSTAYAQNFNANIAPKLTEILTNAILNK